MGIPSRVLVLAAGAVVAGASLTIAAVARYRAPYQPVLERISLLLPPGHESLHGFRIGFVTDTHIGPFIAPADIERARYLLARTGPDLVLFGGDYISESPRYIPAAADVLGRFAATARLGGIAVLGNHDISNDQARIEQALTQAGIRVLRNQAAEMTTTGGSLWIVGIDETILGRADVAAAFAKVPPGAAVIALWHEPDYAEQTAARGAFGQLSGHTHGGQVCLPGIGPIVLPPGGRRFPSGRYQIGGMTLYTARGLGVYRPPVRFNCSPEVTLVTLTSRND